MDFNNIKDDNAIKFIHQFDGDLKVEDFCNGWLRIEEFKNTKIFITVAKTGASYFYPIVPKKILQSQVNKYLMIVDEKTGKRNLQIEV